MKRLAELLALIEAEGLTDLAKTSEYWATAEQIATTGRDLDYDLYPVRGTAYDHEVNLIATWLADPRNWKLNDPLWAGLIEKNLLATGRTR